MFLGRRFGTLLVKEKFFVKNIAHDLKAAGLPERLAKEVADRVETRAEDGWSVERTRQETSVELRRLSEVIDNAYASYLSIDSMGEHCIGEERTSQDGIYSAGEQPKKETMVQCTNVEA